MSAAGKPQAMIDRRAGEQSPSEIIAKTNRVVEAVRPPTMWP
jgi:hypothetical protein